MSGLFISYRRQDAAGYAGRLRTDLARRYSDNRVFFDVTDLAPGTKWVDQIQQAVVSANEILVVIGPQWLTATDNQGRRRIDDPEDFIRSELAKALRLGKGVVPVLVGGAIMPNPSELPADIRDLARRQALELRDERWDADLKLLFGILDPLMGAAGEPPLATMASPAARESQAPATISRPIASGPKAYSPAAGAPAPATPPLMTRIAQAFDVLLGRAARDAAVPSPAPVHLTTSSPLREPRPAVTPAGSPSSRSPALRRHDVFVSYSTEDRAFVEEIVHALELQGRPCWIAHRDIPPGVPSWAEPIVTAIASSRLVLVVLTAHSIASVQVLREVTLAADEKIPLLPVSLDGTQLSPGLRYFFVAGQRLDLAHSTPAEQVQRILPAVDHQLPARA